MNQPGAILSKFSYLFFSQNGFFQKKSNFNMSIYLDLLFDQGTLPENSQHAQVTYLPRGIFEIKNNEISSLNIVSVRFEMHFFFVMYYQTKKTSNKITEIVYLLSY